MATQLGLIKLSIFNFAKSVKKFTQQEAISVLGLTERQFLLAMRAVRKTGYVKIKNDRYIWDNTPVQFRQTDREKVWKAIKINPRFTVQQIARQSGVCDKFSASEIRRFLKEGLIEQYGMTTTIDNKPIKLWRLTLKGREEANITDHDFLMPDALVDMSVKLNFLICSGTAKKIMMTKLQPYQYARKSKKNSQSQEGTMENKLKSEQKHTVDTMLSMIPMGNAGCCVSCDRIFTIIRNQSICPGCGSTAWWPVKHWLNKGAA